MKTIKKRLLLLIIPSISGQIAYCQKTKDDYLLVKDFCAEKIKEDSTNYYYYKGKADAEVFLGEFNLAIKDYSGAIARNSLCGDAFYNRGVAYYEINNMELASKDLKKAIQIEKRIPQAYIYLCLISEAKGKYKSAIDYCTLAIKDSNVYSDAYYNRGLCFSESSDYIRAIKDFKTVISLSYNLNAQINLAYNYAKLKKFDQAEAEINSALQKDSTNAPIYKYKGLIAIEKSKPKDACLFFNKAQDLGAKDVDLYIKKYCNN